MSDTAQIAPLKVANEAFLVASMIERCPKTMMIRELVVNGLEAAAHAPAGERRVLIDSRRHEGGRKLRIWNTGPGLTAAELLQITDLASSLRKQNALDQNFGMGAKVASLPSNKHGLRYRSCVAGRVSEVVMGYRDGTYGRLRIGPERAEVVDATEACRSEGGYDLSQDWTEVLLCGNSPDQDTVTAPYGPSLRVEPDWLGDYLENRFFRLSQDVSLTLAPEIWGGSGPRAMVGLDDRRADFGRTETRTTPSGVKIHYYYDPARGESTKSAAGALGRGGARAAIVFRNEMYDVRSGDAWTQEAPNFAIPFGAKYISVFVELPDDYLVWPEAYRQFLRFRSHDQRQVHVGEFSALVRTYMPAWLAEIIRSLGPTQANYLDEISDELKELLAALGVEAQRPPSEPPGLPQKPKPVEDRTRDQKDAEDRPKADTEKTPPKPKPPTYEKPPEIIGLRTPEQVRERALEGRAAKFYPASHQIFLNLTYPAVADMAAALVLSQQEGDGDADEVTRRIASEIAEWALTKRVSRAVVFSMAKKKLGWRTEEVVRAQSPESLSLAADDWLGLMDVAQTRMAEALSAYRPIRSAA
ncbi:ATP-binding protein [Acidisoma sp. 7E03]